MADHEIQIPGNRSGFWNQFPWWFVGALVLLGMLLYIIVTNPSFSEAFQFIAAGLSLTLKITIGSAIPAILIGVLVAIGCRSKYTFLRNLAFFYLAIVGGIPTLVMILVSYIAVPYLTSWIGIASETVFPVARGTVGLALAYGAIYGDVFRLSFTSTSDNTAGKPFNSLGSKTWIAGGITFIALLKDSSLLMLLGVQEITQMSRLFAGSTFRFQEAYLAVIFLYLVLTIPMRLLLQQYEQRLGFANT